MDLKTAFVIAWFFAGFASFWCMSPWIPFEVKEWEHGFRRGARLISAIVSGAYVCLTIFLAERLWKEVVLNVGIMSLADMASVLLTIFGFAALIVSLLSLVGAIKNLIWKSV